VIEIVPGGDSLTDRLKPPPTTRATRRAALTLIELLVVIALIAVLASLLLPAINHSKEQGRGIQCLSNARQLGLAWIMYADDHAGWLPPNCDGTQSGADERSPSWAGGWLDFDPNPDNINTSYLIDPDYRNGGRLGAYLKNVNVFRCPGDRSQVTIFGRTMNRVRTYSMNCYMGGVGDRGRRLGTWQSREWTTFRRFSDIRKPTPSRAMLMIDEREDSINDGYFSFLMGEQVIVDYPGAYHGRSSNINFADGHSEKKKWTDPRTVPTLNRGVLIPLVVSSAENVDLVWMQQRATSQVPENQGR